MPITLTIQQLQEARNKIDGTASSLNSFYRTMRDAGYGYAKLANDVVNCTWPSGSTAQNYMYNSAKSQGVELSDDDTKAIETQMAKGYADALISTAIANGGFVNTDVTFKQALDFHTKVFAANGLGPQTWTIVHAIPSSRFTNHADPLGREH